MHAPRQVAGATRHETDLHTVAELRAVVVPGRLCCALAVGVDESTAYASSEARRVDIDAAA